MENHHALDGYLFGRRGHKPRDACRTMTLRARDGRWRRPCVRAAAQTGGPPQARAHHSVAWNGRPRTGSPSKPPEPAIRSSLVRADLDDLCLARRSDAIRREFPHICICAAIPGQHRRCKHQSNSRIKPLIGTRLKAECPAARACPRRAGCRTAPRSSASLIYWSIHEVKLIPGGSRSVMPQP